MSLWPFGRATHRAIPWICISFPALLGCSLTNIERKTLPDGSYELTCRSHLSTCLMDIQDTCAEAGYDVVSAFEERKRMGPITPETELVRSHATVRCRKMSALIGDGAGDAGTPRPAVSAQPQPAPPPKVCQPGATQVCVGTGACQGGQQCLPDGSRFGACDCGPPPAPPIPAENPGSTPPAPPPSAVPAPVPSPSSSAPKPPAP